MKHLPIILLIAALALFLFKDERRESGHPTPTITDAELQDYQFDEKIDSIDAQWQSRIAWFAIYEKCDPMIDSMKREWAFEIEKAHRAEFGKDD